MLGRKRKTHDCSAAWYVDMRPVLPRVPLHGRREEARLVIDAVEPALLLGVRLEDDAIRARNLDSYPVVGEACRRVEVEDEDQPGALKDNHLVPFVLERDVRLFGMQPAELGLACVH